MALFKKRTHTIEDELDPSGISSIHAAIGLSVLGLVLALAMIPIVNSKSQELVAWVGGSPGIDRTVTGSVSKKKAVKRYRIRRSVLQKNDAKPCVMFENGTQTGDC